jgi:phenylacetate-CoA ligase
MDIQRRFIGRVSLPAYAWLKGTSAQFRHLREFEASQRLPLDEIRALQLSRLRALVDHAYRRCPYYRDRYDRAGVVPSDLRSLEDLNAFPILEKADIRDRRDDMIASGWPAEDLVPNYTGGSTGTPLAFYLSRDRKDSRWAATIRHNRWAGWDVGDRAAYFWGAVSDGPPPGGWRRRLRQAFLEPQLFLNTANLTEAGMADFNEAMKRFRPKVVLAYARSAAMIARFLRARGIPAYRPRAIVASAEMLEPEDREVIEEVFGCPVFNRYGCREVSVIASECEERRGLHTMAECLHVEIVRDGTLAEPGEDGEILVTDLANPAMPLIRYRIGDVGAWEAGRCGCGRELPRLRHVAGRATDFLVGHDGRMVSGPFLTLAAVGVRPSIGQLQIEQERIGQVLFRIRRGSRFQAAEDLEFLVAAARTHLGETAEVGWEFVDEIPSEASGKFLFCKSKVSPAFLRGPIEAPGAGGR